MLIGTVVAASALGGGCLPASDRAGQPDLDVDGGGGQLVRLQQDAAVAATVPADELCRPGGVAVGAGRVLDCQLVPLVDEAHARCNSTQPSAVFDDARRCRPPQPALADDVIGWALTADAAGARTLAVYRSGSAPAPASPTDRPLAGTLGSTLLQPAYRASDAEARWAELAVCARDIDADGFTDLLVFARSSDPGRADTPEVVVVSFSAAAGAAAATSGDGAEPALRSARPVRAIAAERGQGCASPLVAQLRGAGRDLSLGSERAPA